MTFVLDLCRFYNQFIRRNFCLALKDSRLTNIIKQIVVPNPDVRGRQEILELYLQDKPLGDDIDVKAIARGTPGFNGAGQVLSFY